MLESGVEILPSAGATFCSTGYADWDPAYTWLYTNRIGLAPS
jgi:hypothetical protein